MTHASIERTAERLKLDPASKALSKEFDPLDLTILDLVPELEGPTTPAIAALLGVSVDRVNISVNRLLRLGLLRMNGAVWTATHEEIAI